jgi:hypothetical protein
VDRPQAGEAYAWSRLGFGMLWKTVEKSSR